MRPFNPSAIHYVDDPDNSDIYTVLDLQRAHLTSKDGWNKWLWWTHPSLGKGIPRTSPREYQWQIARHGEAFACPLVDFRESHYASQTRKSTLRSELTIGERARMLGQEWNLLL